MVTEPALTQFALDLAECEKFAQSEPVPGIDKSILVLIFQELSQLLDLIKKEDWAVYFANHNKPTGELLYTTSTLTVYHLAHLSVCVFYFNSNRLLFIPSFCPCQENHLYTTEAGGFIELVTKDSQLFEDIKANF
ncbi:unnamed protein product [Dibothriocephalus latus]|uniref:Uncharacterized protein n=1 Tax=Dibothriocephalus latus TaxID=60516 RepID=A0A3P7NHG9_DIBLA|nr:unnamed protein product [Dibothriocephalus latus]